MHRKTTGLLLFAFLTFISSTGRAQIVDGIDVSQVPTDITCNAGYPGTGGGQPGDHVIWNFRGGHIDPSIQAKFLNELFTVSWINVMKDRVIQSCKGPSKSGGVLVLVGGGGWSRVVNARQVGNGQWWVENIAKQVADQKANTRRAEVERKDQAVKAKGIAAQKAEALGGRYQATSWIQWPKILANPFAYEGKVFLVNTQFDRMLTADTALFGSNPPILMTGVPRTAFTDKKAVVVVGKVIDSDPSKNPPGITGTVVRMKYLGHEFCAQRNCDDFGDYQPR